MPVPENPYRLAADAISTMLEKGALARLKYVIGFVSAYENQFRKIMGARQKAEIKKEISAKKKLLAKCERINELDRQI